MGRTKSNPELVNELISNLWNVNYDQDEFERKYNSLNSSDMSKVAAAINRMEKEAARKDMLSSLW